MTAKDPQTLTAEYWRLYAPYIKKLCEYKLQSAPQAAEDCLNETFLALLSALRRGETIEKPKVWLTVTANRLIIKAYKARKKHTERFVPDAETLLPLIPAPEPVTELTEETLLAAKDDFLAALCPGERELFEQRFVRGEKLKKIAAEAGVPVNTVKQRVFRLKRKGVDFIRQWMLEHTES